MFTQKLAAKPSILLSATKGMVVMFARNQSGWSKKGIERIGNLATWWALLCLPTSVAAYELESEDNITGCGPAPAAVALFMLILLVLKVCDSVRGHMNGLVGSVRRPLKTLWFVILVTGCLAAAVINLVPAFKNVNLFKGPSIAEL